MLLRWLRLLDAFLAEALEQPSNDVNPAHSKRSSAIDAAGRAREAIACENSVLAVFDLIRRRWPPRL
jgi:hypothetical protein